MKVKLNKWTISGGVLLVFGLMQLITIDRYAPEVNKDVDYINMEVPPAHIERMLRTSCYDCHSYETTWPWYSYIAPISWNIGGHVKNGRKELNFSIWGTYPKKRKKHKIDDCIEMVGEDQMPLPSYTFMHRKAKLSQRDKEELVNWFKYDQEHIRQGE